MAFKTADSKNYLEHSLQVYGLSPEQSVDGSYDYQKNYVPRRVGVRVHGVAEHVFSFT